MANKFEKRLWPDRQSQYPERRRLLATEVENIYDIERAEGEVTEMGRAFSADNMDDLETRIHDAFGNLDDTDIRVVDVKNNFTATTLDGVLAELFQSAASGKSAIASAIGSNASSSNTFSQLANLIKSGKQAIANALRNSALATNTFPQLAAQITSKMTQIDNLNTTVTARNKTIQEQNAELALRKRYYYNSSFYVKGGTVAANTKNSYSDSTTVNFGFTPSVIVMWSSSISAPIVSWGKDGVNDYDRLSVRSDSYPTENGIGAGLIVTSKKITVKIWGNKAFNQVKLNSGNYRVLAIA